MGRGTINLPEANTFKGGWKITYCMSDIHGDLDRFQKMLKEIAFSAADSLYILGDVIDYRIGGVAILSQIMQAPNMTLIRGDHEQMCLDALGAGRLPPAALHLVSQRRASDIPGVAAFLCGARAS